MRQTANRKTRSRHITAVFDQLCDKDQQYMATLTAQLAEIQNHSERHTSPEPRPPAGKIPENRVQPKQGKG